MEIVKLLVSKNVDLNIPDQNGLTPYHYAVSQDLDPIAEILEPYRVKSDETFINAQPITKKFHPNTDYCLARYLVTLPNYKPSK